MPSNRRRLPAGLYDPGTPFNKLSVDRTLTHNLEKTHEDGCEKIIADMENLPIG